MIKRDKYLNLLIANRDNGFPKVITGIRRCGKSYLLKEIFKSFLMADSVSPDNILVIELDDERNSRYRNPLVLSDYVRNYCKNKQKCYVFIDEIQKVPAIVNPEFSDGKIVLAKTSDTEIISFVDVVLGLSREKNIDLYVTGSNSKMLSNDIVTEFRDKAVNIHLKPLSFEEFSNYKSTVSTDILYEYMQFGGMPLAVLKEKSEKKQYLKSLFEMTYFADILEHNRLRKTETLDEISNIISASTGNLLNAQKIANTFESAKHRKIDAETVERIIYYFTDSYILNEARRYDIKGRAEIGALRKYYFCDTGLRNARLDFAFSDDGQMLETVVYNELLYNGYSVSVGVFDSIGKNKEGKSVRKTNEIDFFARRDNRRMLIQVSSDISFSKTKKREISPFLLLNNQIQKILVVNKPMEESIDENGFIIIGAVDFLLRFIK